MENIELLLDDSLLMQGIKHMHIIDFTRTPHILSIGNTGTGKTYLNKLIIAKVSLYIPAARITVLDFKADDYQFARETKRLYEFEDCINGLSNFYKEFKERQLGNDSTRTFKLLVIEELGSMLSYFNKKDNDSIKKIIANIVFMGRSFNCHILISSQRPDANLFNAGVRDSIGFVVALGNLSKEGKTMVAKGFEDEIESTYGSGTGYLIENSTTIYRIKVPTISKFKKLEEYIIKALSD